MKRRILQKSFKWGAVLIVIGAVLLGAISVKLESAAFFAAAYAIAVSLFLGAQLVGFVLSQTDVSDEIEKAKFEMLEKEEREWAKVGF